MSYVRRFVATSPKLYFHEQVPRLSRVDVKRVTPVEAKKLVEEQNFVLIDVRSVPEFEQARTTIAHNIPFLHKMLDGAMVPNPEFAEAVKALIADPSCGIVTHCGMGARSVRAALELQNLGYSQVVDMLGGFSGEHDENGEVVHPGWTDVSLPVENGAGSPRGYTSPSGTPVPTVGVETPVDSSPSNPPELTDSAPSDVGATGMNRFASDKRSVYCLRFKKELPGLKRRPYPGQLGVRLYENISAAAWDEWVEHSKMIINEYRIVSTDPKAMEMLYSQCEQFFFGEGVERPAEYVAPE